MIPRLLTLGLALGPPSSRPDRSIAFLRAFRLPSHSSSLRGERLSSSLPPLGSYLTLRSFEIGGPGAQAFATRARGRSLLLLATRFPLPNSIKTGHEYNHRTCSSLNSCEKDTPTKVMLTMDNIYNDWTLEDDKLLYDNKDLSTVRLASLLGRGMHGVEARLKKLTNADSAAYARLFGSVNIQRQTDSGKAIDPSINIKLTPVKEVLRRIQWDPTLDSSSFSILHYDRLEEVLSETPFDAPNDSIAGRETRFVFALPEHRIERVKYLERTIWDKDLRLDCVFGSMNGNGETIDKVVETYESWKKEKNEKEEKYQQRQVEILKELELTLEEKRVAVLKELSSQLMNDVWDRTRVREYVHKAVGLYFDAKRDRQTQNITSNSTDDEKGEGTDVVSFLHLFSDLVALLPDTILREEILQELETAIRKSGRETISHESSKPNQLGALPELKENEISEKFVKGGGRGGQKINKTSNRVILTHLPTQIRVECQDTRSLQQNRKIARKRLRLKIDAFLNGKSSRTSKKKLESVAKKAKNKARNKRRRQQKKSFNLEE